MYSVTEELNPKDSAINFLHQAKELAGVFQIPSFKSENFTAYGISIVITVYSEIQKSF